MTERLADLGDLVREIGAKDLIAGAQVLLRRAQRPGPVVAIIGAAGRGRSTVKKRILDQNGDDCALAHGPDWTASELRELPIKGTRSSVEKLEDVAIIDAPAFDSASTRDDSTSIIQASDIVFFVVQSTSPGGEDEVKYAKQNLEGRACFLIVNKADLAEDELDEALDFAQRAFSGTSWMGMFVSGPVNDRARVEDWWRNSGLAAARLARASVLESEARSISSKGLESIESQIESLRGRETELQATNRKGEALSQVGELSKGIRSDLRRIPRLASECFSKQRGSYSTGFRAVLNQALVASDPSIEVNIDELARDLNDFLRGWDQSARAIAREAMRPEVESLFAKAQQFSLLLERTGLSKRPQLKAPPSTEVGDEALVSAPDVQLSEAERRRAVLNPILGGGGTVLLGHTLLAFMGPVAWIAGLAAGAGVFSMNRAAQGEQNRRKLLNDLERAMLLQSSQVYNELEERFARDWRAYSYSIEAQLAPALRAADIAQRSQVDKTDPRPDLSSVRDEQARLTELQLRLRQWGAV